MIVKILIRFDTEAIHSQYFLVSSLGGCRFLENIKDFQLS